jgi:hypothetical protein
LQHGVGLFRPALITDAAKRVLKKQSSKATMPIAKEEHQLEGAAAAALAANEETLVATNNQHPLAVAAAEAAASIRPASGIIPSDAASVDSTMGGEG